MANFRRYIDALKLSSSRFSFSNSFHLYICVYKQKSFLQFFMCAQWTIYTQYLNYGTVFDFIICSFCSSIQLSNRYSDEHLVFHTTVSVCIGLDTLMKLLHPICNNPTERSRIDKIAMKCREFFAKLKRAAAAILKSQRCAEF